MQTGRSLSHSPAGAVRDRARRLCLVWESHGLWSCACLCVRAASLVCRPRGTARIRPESTTHNSTAHLPPPLRPQLHNHVCPSRPWSSPGGGPACGRSPFGGWW
uniref:(northern house mosquito) hypothetical protein n=1 Tax=Culex pipiens TaxID=7175 RepID=A0A8D8G0Y8_CULPI